MIVIQIKKVMFCCWILFHILVTSFMKFKNWNLYRKVVDFIKTGKARAKKYKLVTFQPKAYRKHLSLCPRSEKPSNFDSFTVMVVFLLVYMKLLLWYLWTKSHTEKGSLVTLWTRHLVLKCIVISLFTPYCFVREDLLCSHLIGVT